jgi:hypothetical protein
VESFTYLGVTLHRNGKWTEAFKAVLKKAKQRTNSMHRILDCKRLAAHTRLKMWKAMVRPLLEYGAHVMCPNKTTLSSSSAGLSGAA